ncbi:AMP-binding protein [Hippea sp. KM1]|uniref:AMP-binding protein n=1 Tax=Hippea sp. KM1 TaxID=944481 RepID=UPI00046D0C12|nr:AMP-binding protein [Hippea sp. KM1]
MNISQKILDSLEGNPNKRLVFEDTIYTYGYIASMIRKAASLLRKLGVSFGDRVALQLPKSMEFIYFHFANMLIGAITLPLNPSYSEAETEYYLSDSGSYLFITTKENSQRLKGVIDRLKIKTFLVDEEMDKINDVGEYKEKPTTQPDDVAIIAYTSGTTGRSKGAMITHKNLITNMEALKKLWRMTDKDKLLHVLPIFHVHGLVVALQGGLNAAMDIVMHEKFDPIRTLKTIESERITLFMGVPTIYSRLTDALQKLEGRIDLSSMRLFISGSAPLTKVLFEKFYSLTGHRILERYGMSEAGMITSNPYEPKERIPLSVGYPLEGCSIKIVKDGKEAKPFEVGEVYIKGTNVFKGYWQMPKKTEESFDNGWFKSGDLGYTDNSGRLFLVGRAKELIITGGLNVYPKEVENVLDSHPDVKESAVFGVKDDDFGERVEAAVVLDKGIDPQDLIDYCKKNLAHYKCPKRIHILDELPKNAMGKVQKNILIERFS